MKWAWVICSVLGHREENDFGYQPVKITSFGAFYACARCDLLIKIIKITKV